MLSQQNEAWPMQSDAVVRISTDNAGQYLNSTNA